MNPEVRAAEIAALIATDYRDGGWFAAMTPGEREGWDLHEDEWFNETPVRAPRNHREWAGWLAREIMFGGDGVLLTLGGAS